MPLIKRAKFIKHAVFIAQQNRIPYHIFKFSNISGPVVTAKYVFRFFSQIVMAPAKIPAELIIKKTASRGISCIRFLSGGMSILITFKR